MEPPTDSQPPSAFRRLARYFDPADAAFLRRMLKLGGGAALLAGCALVAALALAASTEEGRYSVAYTLSVTHHHEPALAWSSDLVDDYPTSRWEYYRLKAYNLRHLGRVDESLAVYDAAVAAMPDAWWPHSHRCFYGATLGDPDLVLDSCDRSVELDPDFPEIAHDRRAIARGLSGDLAGAAEDLRVAVETYRLSGYYSYELEVRERWLRTLEDGGNPFTTEEIAQEMTHY